MLTAFEPVALASPVLTLRTELTSAVVRLALVHVAQAAGWGPCRHPGRCPCLVLTDRCLPDRPTQVLVVRDAPATCQDAVEAVLAGRAHGVLLWNEPEALEAVFAAARHGSTLIPRRVLDLAATAPRLTSRQRHTLRLLAMGRSNQAIAAATHQSLSTAKRDITELLHTFDVPNRTALMSTATALGFVGPGLAQSADHPAAADG